VRCGAVFEMVLEVVTAPIRRPKSRARFLSWQNDHDDDLISRADPAILAVAYEAILFRRSQSLSVRK
jgi:hypothetical protein